MGEIQSSNLEYLQNLETKEITLTGSDFIIVNIDSKAFVNTNWICNKIGLSKKQRAHEYKRLRKDLVLKQGVCYCNFETTKYLYIDWTYIIIWICKINTKALTKNQLSNVQKYFDYHLTFKVDLFNGGSERFDFESHLRDELFQIKHILDIKITDKEVSYDFGRIDLLGVDYSGNDVCIELKKDKNFKDTKQQLLRYKESTKFSRIIYIAAEIDSEFKNWCLNNNIEPYVYKRTVQIEKP